MIDRIRIIKSERLLVAECRGRPVLRFRAALGKCPAGRKEREGDGRTPEGEYRVCLKKAQGKYGPSLGLDYPSPEDARLGGADERLISLIESARREGRRPPWGSFLGGEIYIHGGGSGSDWTAGCIALDDADAARLFDETPLLCPVEIVP